MSKHPARPAWLGSARGRSGSARWAGPVVAGLGLALVGFSVLHNGAGAADDPRQARHVIGTDAQRATGPAKAWAAHYDATH